MAYLEGRHLHLSTAWLLEHFLKPLGGFHYAALPVYTHYHPNDSRLLSLLQSSRKWERCMPMGSQYCEGTELANYFKTLMRIANREAAASPGDPSVFVWGNPEVSLIDDLANTLARRYGLDILEPNVPYRLQTKFWNMVHPVQSDSERESESDDEDLTYSPTAPWAAAAALVSSPAPATATGGAPVNHPNLDPTTNPVTEPIRIPIAEPFNVSVTTPVTTPATTPFEGYSPEGKVYEPTSELYLAFEHTVSQFPVTDSVAPMDVTPTTVEMATSNTPAPYDPVQHAQDMFMASVQFSEQPVADAASGDIATAHETNNTWAFPGLPLFSELQGSYSLLQAAAVGAPQMVAQIERLTQPEDRKVAIKMEA